LADTIESYLTELKAALAGADPALVQDAVYDADEYLRSAVAEAGDSATAVATAIGDYGTPAEVAAAYRDREATVAAALRRPTPATAGSVAARFFRVVADPGAWGALFYMLLALVTGIVYFTIVVTGLSLIAGTLVLIVGIPLALLFIAVVRAISLAEGRLVEGLLGVRMPRRPRTVASAGEGNGLWVRLKSWFTDYRTWTTMLYMVVQLVLGIVYFTVVVTALSVSAALVALPIVQGVFHVPSFVSGGYGYFIDWWAMPLVMAIGVLGFFVTLWIAKGVGYLHGNYAKFMLVGRFEGGQAEQATAADAGAADVVATPAPGQPPAPSPARSPAPAASIDTGYVPPAAAGGGDTAS
jgi:uncharacterized membrane protein